MEDALAFWRDLSIVWLTLLTILIVAVPGVLVYLAQLYLRRFRRWLRTPLLDARVWALRIAQHTQRVSVRVANVPITLYALGARLQVTTRGALHILLDKRGGNADTT